jgi:cell division protein FtsB
MQKINIRKFVYHVRHKYLTFNNLVILTAFLIAAGWVWGSLNVMQRNYGLQKEVDYKKRQLQLTELQKDNLELQKRYYETNEYKELAARESLGLVMPGEKVLILPENSVAAKEADAKPASATTQAVPQDKTSNLEQWLNFLFGGYSRTLNANSSNDNQSTH